MSVNKYMHPRNIYRKPPDFSQLALRYPEFLEISKLDVSGKVSIDFKDPNSLRVLTKCLLHSDFALNVHIPEDRLVPTLPLRLNYILWIEDLLGDASDVTGIDIGTGACAVYPLLGATKNKWQMIGTETDAESYKAAVQNVQANNLENLVTIKYNSSTSLLDHCFSENSDAKYDFCMCNPPFYSSFQELCESRSTSRPPPKNAFTGSISELITEGGEVQFVSKLIDESANLKENIRIFTTMLGHKVSLKELTAELHRRTIQHTHAEFCQGHTTRWGLAWTYSDTCHLDAPPRSESRKKNASMAFVLQPLPDVSYDIDTITKRVTHILDQLSISHKLYNKKGPKISMEVKAYINTWSNQRRKRRQQKRLEAETAKKSKPNEDMAPADDVTKTLVENNNTDCESKHPKDLKSINTDGSEPISFETNHENICINETPKQEPSTSKVETKTSVKKEAILHALLSIGKLEEDIVLNMEFLRGSAGKDGMHQVFQFIKNNWK